jgi:hypothetical protein
MYSEILFWTGNRKLSIEKFYNISLSDTIKMQLSPELRSCSVLRKNLLVFLISISAPAIEEKEQFRMKQSFN